MDKRVRNTKAMQFRLLENDDLSILTGRQIDLLKMADELMSYEEISLKIGIQIGTVKSRLHRLRHKVLANRRERAEAILMASILRAGKENVNG